jgi:preprotein translocase subunit SecG
MTPEARKIMKLQQTKKEKDLQRKKDLKNMDPYLSLGYGLIAYRTTLYTLAVGFFLMSLIMYPVIKAYKKGEAIDLDVHDTVYGIFSLANLGYSSVQCGTIPFNQDKLVLSCPFGNITQIVDAGQGFGVTPFSAIHRDACLRRDENLNVECSAMLNQENIASYFQQDCKGQKSCELDIQDPNILGSINFSLKDGACNDQRAQFFIQYTCEQSQEIQGDTYNQIALATATIMFVAFFFILLIYYLQTTSRLDQLEYDINTVSAGDFTVEFNIST